jgi:hypothetical protein
MAFKFSMNGKIRVSGEVGCGCPSLSESFLMFFKYEISIVKY